MLNVGGGMWPLHPGVCVIVSVLTFLCVLVPVPVLKNPLPMLNVGGGDAAPPSWCACRHRRPRLPHPCPHFHPESSCPQQWLGGAVVIHSCGCHCLILLPFTVSCCCHSWHPSCPVIWPDLHPHCCLVVVSILTPPPPGEQLFTVVVLGTGSC